MGVGLCLCGGGITGALYEVGCLAAIEDEFEDFEASSFDAYVGSSAGATVALALAGGYNATRLYRALLDPADDFFPLARNHLLRFDMLELRRVWGATLGAVRHLFSSAASNPLSLDVWNELDRFYDSLPAGIFTLDAYEKFLDDFVRRRGIPRRFSEFGGRLMIVANDLDAGRRAVFGEGDLQATPVTKAVTASAASAPLFAPVRVDGRDYVDGGLGEVAHADLLLRAECDSILVINPMVPIYSDPEHRDVPTGHGKRKRVRDKGLLWVMNQSWRIRTEARFRKLFEQFQKEHPEVTVTLLEPDGVEATMFMYSPMNFAARRVILEDAFKGTKERLRADSSPLRDMLLSSGFTLKQSDE